MEQKKQAVATRFAEKLVGSMLQRSGVEFVQTQSAQRGSGDFLVRDGDMVVEIEVKYASDSNKAGEMWEAWLGRAATPALVFSEVQKLKEAKHDVWPARLIIVTDAGEAVFTDAATARLLGTDHRTSLSILSPVASRQKRNMVDVTSERPNN